jgi:hypothetical protein
MTSQGHPYTRFKRALDRQNAPAAWAAAAELPKVSLSDALALCLVTAHDAPARFERAAARWMTRYLAEEPRLELDELRLTAELLASVRGAHAGPASRALRELFDARGRSDLAEVLDRALPPSR